jgi:hypothetical protein
MSYLEVQSDSPSVAELACDFPHSSSAHLAWWDMLQLVQTSGERSSPVSAEVARTLVSAGAETLVGAGELRSPSTGQAEGMSHQIKGARFGPFQVPHRHISFPAILDPVLPKLHSIADRLPKYGRFLAHSPSVSSISSSNYNWSDRCIARKRE